ncbi:carboxypeptidase-like regulatory domain-containing protein, partial [Polynucleobacter sp. 39-46-10]
VWIFGAKIKILNTMNQVIFDAQADGPYILINLTAGQYQIEASYQGSIQKKSVLIQGSGLQKLAIFWK